MSRSWNGKENERNGIKTGTGRVEQRMNGMGLKLGLEG